MPTVSTQDPSLPTSTSLKLPFGGLLCGFTALCAYLWRGVQHSGDGASYVLQAIEGQTFERSLHVGYLLSLKFWVGALGWIGVTPSAAANLLAVLSAAIALVLVTAIAHDLLSELPDADRGAPWFPFAALAAPLSLLCAQVSWEAALFAEVYGPLATVLLGAAVALRRNRDVLAALLLLGAALIHPGSWLLVPGLLVAGGRGPDRRSLQLVATALLPWLLCLGLLAPEWWSGGRGLLALPAFERSPWQSLQVAWRLLSQDLGLGAAPILLGTVWIIAHPEHVRARRWVGGVLLVTFGAALAVDRYPDNCGQLPALWMACAVAPLACSWLRVLSTRRAQRGAALGGLLILALCIADATSKHDAEARRTLREHAARMLQCGPDASTPSSWRDAQLSKLACLNK